LPDHPLSEKKHFLIPFFAYCHDYEFLLRTIGGGLPFAMIEEKLLYYRLHDRNTIRENEFLKHLEVMHAIFTVVAFEKILEVSSQQERMKSAIVRSLFENPEFNREKYSFEYLRIIEEQNLRFEEVNRKLRELSREITSRDERLEQADVLLREFKEKLEEREITLEELSHEITSRDERLKQSDELLREIYHSNGWLWLTRYRTIKVWLSKRMGISWTKRRLSNWIRKNSRLDKLQAGQKERSAFLDRAIACLMKGPLLLLKTFRDVKRRLRVKENAPSREPVSSCFVQHVEIQRPLESERPLVVHAIANFMTGGSSRLVADLIEHLGHRYEQEVITYYEPKPPAYTGFPIYEAPRSKRMIASYLMEKKPRILHVHYWGECDEPWYRKVFEAAREHCCAVIENVNTPVEPYMDEIVNHYVYVSNYARKVGLSAPEPFTVIYPGSNLDMFSRNGSPIPDNVIGMVYRLEADKLQDNGIQVFIEVIKKRPETRCLIVGGGTFLESYKRQVAQQGLSGSFEFTGYVPYDRLPDFYRRFFRFRSSCVEGELRPGISFCNGNGDPRCGLQCRSSSGDT
jgi:predicted DCC family thiol-disulfide oxidoreductase YuxK